MRRRLLAPIALAAALALSTTAAAALQPVRRTFGEQTFPRLRAGTIRIPSGQADGRVRVIVTLKLPPLAAAFARTPAALGAQHRLDVGSASSRAYLARVDAAQRAAVARLQRAIPEARVSRRFGVVLDGLTVSLPARRLPALVRLGFAHVYPSMRFTLALDKSPSVIGATELTRLTGADGTGVKIGIVDDGVDQTNPFLNPAGYTYPAGFPQGGPRWTSPKVIVAKSFPGPGSGAPGRLAVDRNASFHGTHVAGIAAGDAGTTATAGRDHPQVCCLSGVAPHAWIGNYRVFTVPTPIGHVANTPEIVAAFESAVDDGMDVINFSGGGPQTDPANDAMVETIRNVAAAGVVPVIAAGNDRDDFGLGTAGSPGTAPAGISVAAVSNTHVFAPELSVVASGAPDAVKQIPIEIASTPAAWASSDQTLVDVGTVVGADGTPVERHLCGPFDDPNNGQKSNVPAGSLQGAIALVFRGNCTFVSKAERARAAGAVGIVLVDNRAGEANPIPIALPVPAGMVADLDGARLRDYLDANAGRAPVRVGRDPLELETGRSAIVTSFSSAGPTDFGHDLKPDVAAPGGQVLSSTLPEFTGGSPFAVFDGTSMATPHVTGAAALLIERHPGWTPQQVKSALVSSAGPAWGNTARTEEASVLLAGGGLINLPRADDPKLFTNPVSLSFDPLDVTGGAQSRGLLLRLSDAGGGEGSWQVQLQPQSATAGATLDVPSTVAIAAGGEAQVPVVARANADAAKGLDTGFLVLRRGDTVRRVPYLFEVERPALASAQPVELRTLQIGDTRTGLSRANVYCCPSEPFGPPPNYNGGEPMDESGAEKVYVTHLNAPVANIGVSVLAATPGAAIDPWLLGSLNENDVQGYAGTPTDVNNLTFDFQAPIGAAAAVFPRQQEFFVSVDSGSDVFTGQALPGQYVLKAYVNDVTPPRVRLLTTRVAGARPTIIARVTDGQAGVDPLSLVISYRRVLVGAALYDPLSGLAVFPLPTQAPAVKGPRQAAILVASDFQEAKNVNTTGLNIMPNTTFRPVKIRVLSRPAVDWISPPPNVCAFKAERLVVTASSTEPIRSVTFRDGARKIRTVTTGAAGIYAADWSTKNARPGKHTLVAVARDRRGRTASATETVKICR